MMGKRRSAGATERRRVVVEGVLRDPYYLDPGGGARHVKCRIRSPLRRFVASSLCRFFLIALIFCASATVRAAEPLERTSQKGPVEATVRLEPDDPAIGDAVSLTLRVVAEKGVELLMPEFGQALERYAILDYSTGDRIDEQGRTVGTQHYALQPPRSGKQSIPPIMIEFVDRRGDARAAPEGMDAYELLTERLPFEVRSVLPDDAATELNPPLLAELPPLDRTQRRWWPWIVAAVLIIAVAVVAGRTIVSARRRSAYDIAIGRLDRLLNQSQQVGDHPDAFFVELSSIVRWYLETRFDLRAPELTTEEFLGTMSQSPDLTCDHQSLLRTFLSRADLVKFANFVPNQADIDQSISAARRFLDETRQDAPMIVQPPSDPPSGREDRLSSNGPRAAEEARTTHEVEATRV